MGGFSGNTTKFDSVFNKHNFKYGDKVVFIKRLKQPKYNRLEIGKVYTVDIMNTDNAISLSGVNVLYVGIFNASCFKSVSDYKQEQLDLRLKKVKYLKKPKWYKKIHKFIQKYVTK